MLKWGKNMRYYKRSHVHYSKSAMKIIALVFMLVGVTFLAVGIGFAIHQTQLKNRCTLEVNAIISDILSKDERHENDDGHVTYSTVYTPGPALASSSPKRGCVFVWVLCVLPPFRGLFCVREAAFSENAAKLQKKLQFSHQKRRFPIDSLVIIGV